MKKVSAKKISEILALHRAYHEVWFDEERGAEILKKSHKIVQELEKDTGVFWTAWLDIVHAACGIDADVTDDEVFCALRCLGVEPEVDHVER